MTAGRTVLTGRPRRRKENRIMLKKNLFTLTACALILGAGALAQDVPEGEWIDLFDGESLFGWTAFGDAEWEIKDGAIYCREGWDGFLATTCRFTDYDLQIRMQVEGSGTAGLVVRGSLEGHHSKYGGAQIVLSEEQHGDGELDIQVKAAGEAIMAAVNGKAVEGLAASQSRGNISLQYQRYHGSRGPRISVREVKLRPINMKSVFNGENLDGWNIIPGHKSEFKVVDGAINITNGNGQIETDQVFRDFVAQLEIISNGEHLNSGVFFRGPKGVFWKGYEAQVRNQWVKDDRTKPVDFGTGGIYGVDPARKVVSTDGEWFKKTIVCEGNHMAVWINGYQVSDFYDTRPAVTNGDGKAGYVPEAGTIHLQGHDPTTDLSFKNITVQEYPPCKCPPEK
jgi:hypothetical protein